MLPTIFSLARGRIALRDMTGMSARKRFVMPRT
jgi:hypothetical protein